MMVFSNSSTTTSGSQHAQMIYPEPTTGRVSSASYWRGMDATLGEEISKKPSLRQVQQWLALAVVIAVGALGFAMFFVGIGNHSVWTVPGIVIIGSAIGLGKLFNKLLPDRK